MTLHHIIPVRRGGTHCLENLVIFCRDCHDAIEVMEAQWERDLIDEEAEAFVTRYVAMQHSIGRWVGRQERETIRRALQGR